MNLHFLEAVEKVITQPVTVVGRLCESTNHSENPPLHRSGLQERDSNATFSTASLELTPNTSRFAVGELGSLGCE